MESIRVCLRMRPMSQKEMAINSEPAFVIDDKNIQINRKTLKDIMMSRKGIQPFSYQFNSCYDVEADNFLIFQQSIKDIILSCLQGINGTIFMYGQTGSGKTYTMLGSKKPELASKNTQSLKQFIQESFAKKEFNDIGILIYSLMEIFKEINKDKERQYDLNCSYYEIYNENIFDLLKEQNKMSDSLQIVTNQTNEFSIKNLQSFSVTSLEEVIQLIHLGEKNRHYAETILNHQSSRSHTIFTINITSYKEDIDDQIQRCTEACINFIDLAGSERISNHHNLQEDLNDENPKVSKQVKERVKESQSINKSLFFLTQIIALRTQKVLPTHLPFRNSTLTKIMKSSLSGNFRTVIILCITPTLSQFDQSQSTLKFGLSSKLIENKIEQNITYTNTQDGDIDSLITDLYKKSKEQEETIKYQQESIQSLQQQIKSSPQNNLKQNGSMQGSHDEIELETQQMKYLLLEKNNTEMSQRIVKSNEQILEYYTSHKDQELLIFQLRQQNIKLQNFAQQALGRLEIYENQKGLSTMNEQELEELEKCAKKTLQNVTLERQKLPSKNKISKKQNPPIYFNSSEENLQEITRDLMKEHRLHISLESSLFNSAQSQSNIQILNESVFQKQITEIMQTWDNQYHQSVPKTEAPSQQTSISYESQEGQQNQPFKPYKMKVSSKPTNNSQIGVKKSTVKKFKNQHYSPPSIKQSKNQSEAVSPKQQQKIHQAVNYINNISEEKMIKKLLNKQDMVARSKSQECTGRALCKRTNTSLEREKKLLQDDIQTLADKLYGLAEKCSSPGFLEGKGNQKWNSMNPKEIIYEVESEVGFDSRGSLIVEEEKHRIMKQIKLKF